MKKTFSTLACAALMAFLQTESRAQLVTGPSSSQSPYVVPTYPGAQSTAIITVGDAVNGYKMVGLPDGLGAYDNGNGTFTVLMNHEIGGTAGVVRAHGSTGAFVSKWVINKSDLSVVSGADLIQNVKVWDNATQTYLTFNAATPSTLARFDRFCSADLPSPGAFYNAVTGMGTQNRIFMNGEESGAEGRGFAHISTGTEAGTSYQLPRLGRYSYENAIPHPASGDKTIVVGLDDATPGQVYVYIGTKTNSGSDIERAGLTNGNLYGVAVPGYINETSASFPAANTAFGLAPLGNVTGLTGAQLETASNTLGITRFLRPEDGAWDPRHPEDFYFVTTNGFNSPSRLWKLHFTNAGDLTLGGTITAVLDGTEGQQMLDNIGFDKYGNIMMQEDVGNQTHLGKTWNYNTDTDVLTEVASHDPSRFITGGANFLTQDEEASGAVDMQDILGAGWWLADDQAHYNIPGELVQGGQLFAFFSPISYNAACAGFTPTITVSPSTPVPGQMSNTIYLGYGPSTVSLTASAPVTNGTVSYSWTPLSSTNSVISVSPVTTTTYTVTATDAIGCVATATQSITVKDIRDGNKDKVFICKEGKTMSVSVNAVPAQLANGVTLGNCNSGAKMTGKEGQAENLKVYPNPTGNGQFTIETPAGASEIVISDISGKVIERRAVQEGHVKAEFNLGAARGIYIIRLTGAERSYQSKITLQ